ncbi:MAG TPA: HAMP domain-containing sensor histidine kinase [Paenibacillaceae bacterium]
MGTKWRSRLAIGAALLFLTIGANGVLAGLTDIGRYAGKSFVDASGIDGELGLFVQYLSFFELAPISFEEARQEIRVSRGEIESYRNRWAVPAQPSDEEIRRAIVEEKEEDLRRHFEYLDGLRADFNRYRQQYAFYFTDVETGEVYTNLDAELEKHGGDESVAANEMLFVLRFPDELDGRLTVYKLPDNLPYKEELVRVAAERPVKHFAGWIGVPKSEAFLARYREYRLHQWYAFGMVGAGAILLALLAAAGRKPAAQAGGAMGGLPAGVRTVWRKIPADIRLILLLLTGIAAVDLHKEPILPFDRLFGGNPVFSAVEAVWRLAVLAVLTAAFAVQLWCAYRTLKEREAPAEAWRKSLIMRLVVLVRDAFLNLKVGAQALLLTVAAFALGFAGCAVVAAGDRSHLAVTIFLLAVAAFVPLVFFALREAGYLNRLLAAAREDADGKVVGDLPASGKSVMAELTAHWNRMRQSAEASRAKEAKSERLKTELITNVSHDLRTPLTSIISYVELLKRPDLPEEERASYIDILDQKSKRLKVLIDDLFEATKMASGNVELSRERIDLAQLIQQALAESGAKAGDGGIEFRVKLPEEPVFAFVDGKKMWRVFDNLISNILRYSLEGSRAYITLGRLGSQAEIVFKNITKYELGDNVDELLERFKRGDASRHTEGSGLGLAIAKSIVDLHGGKFELELDGDLFKAKVLLPAA